MKNREIKITSVPKQLQLETLDFSFLKINFVFKTFIILTENVITRSHRNHFKNNMHVIDRRFKVYPEKNSNQN